MSRLARVLAGAIVVGSGVALLVACGGAERDESSGADGDAASGVDGDAASGTGSSTVLAAGSRHSCRLLPTDGRVLCWGANDDALDAGRLGYASPPPGIAFDVIAAADHSSCGIRRSDRRLECWGTGWDISFAWGVPLEALALGSHSTLCVIRRGDRQVVCLGAGREDAAGPPVGVGFSAIAASHQGACGIRHDDGIAQCWGDAPEPPEGVAFRAIGGAGLERGASSYSATYCGIRRDEGEVVCWGTDDHGQASPPTGIAFEQVTVGGSHACGVRADGTVACWGDDGRGQASPPDGVAFDHIAAGAFHTCGVRRADGQVQCWGRDDHGEVSGAPSPATFDLVAAGDGFACGRGTDGALRCWGRDEHAAVSGAPHGVTLETLSASWDHVCGVRRADGGAECWGRNDRGQASPPAGISFETIVVDHVTQTALSTSEQSHSCGIRRSDGHVVCWGDSEAPAGVAFDVIAGECGLRREDGGVQCWGAAAGAEHCEPLAGVRFSALTMAAYDAFHSTGCCERAWALCGLASDGYLQCRGGWNPPTQCRDWGAWAAGTQFDALAATHGGIGEAGFVCGIRRGDGRVRCSHAGFGHGAPPEGVAFSAISVGRSHVCGIRRDGTLTCWGSRVWNPR